MIILYSMHTKNPQKTYPSQSSCNPLDAIIASHVHKTTRPLPKFRAAKQTQQIATRKQIELHPSQTDFSSHRHIVFFTISLVKNNKCYLPKSSAPEWPRNKLLATTCSVTQNGYKFLIFFFHSETNLKVLVAQLGIDPRPLGLRTPQPWPL